MGLENINVQFSDDTRSFNTLNDAGHTLETLYGSDTKEAHPAGVALHKLGIGREQLETLPGKQIEEAIVGYCNQQIEVLQNKDVGVTLADIDRAIALKEQVQSAGSTLSEENGQYVAGLSQMLMDRAMQLSPHLGQVRGGSGRGT